jgi:integrase
VEWIATDEFVVHRDRTVSTRTAPVHRLGEPVEAIQRAWKSACSMAGLPSLCYHDLRSLNATTLVALGVDPTTTQVRLVHADVLTTLDIYARGLLQQIVWPPALPGIIFDRRHPRCPLFSSLELLPV